MIRILAPCLFVLSSLSAVAQTPAEQKPPVEQKGTAEVKPAVACVYNSKSYSEGEKLSSRCTAPAPRLNKYQRAAIWNRRNIAREISPPTDSSPFCFYTNGKRFCE